MAAAIADSYAKLGFSVFPWGYLFIPLILILLVLILLFLVLVLILVHRCLYQIFQGGPWGKTGLYQPQALDKYGSRDSGGDAG